MWACVQNGDCISDMDPYASTGEKMSEPEIDALMAGQEDENGSVHYEGKLWLFQIFGFLFLKLL